MRGSKGGGGAGCLDRAEKIQNIGFLIIAGPDRLATKSAFKVGPLLMVFGSSPPLSRKEIRTPLQTKVFGSVLADRYRFVSFLYGYFVSLHMLHMPFFDSPLLLLMVGVFCARTLNLILIRINSKEKLI